MKRLAILSSVAVLAAFGWSSSALAINAFDQSKNSQRFLMEFDCDGEGSSDIRTFLALFTRGGGPEVTVEDVDSIVYERGDHVPGNETGGGGAPEFLGPMTTVGPTDDNNNVPIDPGLENPREHTWTQDADANAILVRATVTLRVQAPDDSFFSIVLDETCGIDAP